MSPYFYSTIPRKNSEYDLIGHKRLHVVECRDFTAVDDSTVCGDVRICRERRKKSRVVPERAKVTGVKLGRVTVREPSDSLIWLTATNLADAFTTEGKNIVRADPRLPIRATQKMTERATAVVVSLTEQHHATVS